MTTHTSRDFEADDGNAFTEWVSKNNVVLLKTPTATRVQGQQQQQEEEEETVEERESENKVKEEEGDTCFQITT